MPVSLHPEMLKQRAQRGTVAAENFRLIYGDALGRHRGFSRGRPGPAAQQARDEGSARSRAGRKLMGRAARQELKEQRVGGRTATADMMSTVFMFVVFFWKA